ncbi:hypothetical protein SAMN04487962_1535 [Marinobacter segnicrescens]|uniref:PEP-CTERM protein-sorting domain-containing protein n=1 Tax=Marinobacter segnicrescens TaxID=430453 RepID=A0A1I0IB79_9GAMM|nr:PEP-CTERM sorting domain-containing protein [Marinobacter segnicrescens]SET94049.1 hypothetical protein SAMN04487962_1535 [Marinobacter segnicrescens]
MILKPSLSCVLLICTFGAVNTAAAPVYLNETNISVAIGSGTSPGSFNNTFSNGNTINKVIDAPSADAEEFHNQSTHIWFTADSVGGGLELDFDFGQEYDISTLHFWNYTGEDYDVDEIDFTFFSASNAQVGTLEVFPDLGSSPGITAQDIILAAPLNVQYVTAFLTGSNRQVDFQNIGFSAELSDPTNPGTDPAPISGPGTLGLLSIAFASLFGRCRHSKKGD